jgi:predicted transcriptional regulator
VYPKNKNEIKDNLEKKITNFFDSIKNIINNFINIIKDNIYNGFIIKFKIFDK